MPEIAFQRTSASASAVASLQLLVASLNPSPCISEHNLSRMDLQNYLQTITYIFIFFPCIIVVQNQVFHHQFVSLVKYAKLTPGCLALGNVILFHPRSTRILVEILARIRTGVHCTKNVQKRKWTKDSTNKPTDTSTKKEMEEWRNDVMTGLHYHAIEKQKKL